MRTPRQVASAIENLKKIKKPGGAGNKAWIEAGRKNLKKSSGFQKGHVPAAPFTSEVASKLRKEQLELEIRMADQLVAEGYQVFSPTVVCDRIAVKDGKVYFVEFKQPGQQLRTGQQIIHDLVPKQYLIRYNDRGME